MTGKVSMHKLIINVMACGLAAVCATAVARDSSDEAPFGPGGPNYTVPDPTNLFLLQEAGLKTTLKEEPLLNAIPVRNHLLLYSANMAQMHENFLKTTLGRQLGRQDLSEYLQVLAYAFEEDYCKGDGSYTEAVVAERKLSWEMLGDFYGKARREFAATLYWSEGSENANFVMIASFSNSNELNQAANVVRDYFVARREKNSHLSVVDRTYRSKLNANAIKQLNSDQVSAMKESYCVRNNLVIYARGPLGVEDVLERLDNPTGAITLTGEAFKILREKAGTFSSQAPADLFMTARLDAALLAHLPAGMQTNLEALVAAAEGKAIDVGAGIYFDTASGRIQEKVFLIDTSAPNANLKAVENNFMTARLLDPARTVLYASTAGSVEQWQGLFVKEQIFERGVPKFLTTDAARAALGGEVAVAYLTRDIASRSKADYLRTVLILEEKDPSQPAKLDAFLVEAKQACGEAFKDSQGGSGARIMVGESAIIAQSYLVGAQKDLEDLDRDGYNAVLDRQPDDSRAEPGRRKADLARNFYPAYTIVTLLDADNKAHNYVVMAYSLNALRQVINGVRQPSNLSMNLDFRERMAAFKNDPGEVVFVNYPVALQFLNDDAFNVGEAEASALSLGNLGVKLLVGLYKQAYDSLKDGVEPAAFNCIRHQGGYMVEGQSASGNLGPLGLVLGYSGLKSREVEYDLHAREIRAKLHSIKLALELYHAEAGRYPMRETLQQLAQYLATDRFTPDKQFEELQAAEFERVFCLLPGGKVLPAPDQVKVPQQSNLIYVEGIEDRTLGSAVLVYEAKPSGKRGSFFCLQHDGRISNLTATELAALLPPNDKIRNPYSQALVEALEAAAAPKR